MQATIEVQLQSVAMEFERMTGLHPSVGLIEQGEGNFNAFAEFSTEDWNKVQTFNKAILKEAFDKTPLSILNGLLSQKSVEVRKIWEKDSIQALKS